MNALSYFYLSPSSCPKPILSRRSSLLSICANRNECKLNSPITTTNTNTVTTISESCYIKQTPSSSLSPPPLTLSLLPKSTKRSLHESFFMGLDEFVIKFIDAPLRPSIDPRHVLSGNFAPVGELPPTECQVIYGTLPACLDGAYIRNGPNPQYYPRGPYHLFDGDGMLHSIRISKGRATLCSRFVKTYKYTVKKKVGHPVIPNVFSGLNGLPASISRALITIGRVLTGQFNPSNGIGLANTNVFYYKNKLYALGESDLPYSIKVDDSGGISTISRHDFDGKLSVGMTAHPKIDPETGEAFAFRFNPLAMPYLTFFRFDSSGSKQSDVPIFSMMRPSFLHDFAITKNYAIFAEIQIGLNLKQMIRGGSLVGADLTRNPRLGLIPRYAKDESEMVWFEVAGFNMVHVINAWEEDGGDTVVMVAPNIQKVEHALDRMDLIHSSVEKVKIEVKTGKVTRETVSYQNLDFGVINPAFVGKKNRFAYAAIGDPMPKIIGIVKIDLSITDGNRDCVVASHMFEPGCYGGEPFFVTRRSENSNLDEDDGYLISYVHNEITGKSRFLVMDYKSPGLEIVAIVLLPHRIPYGFHGIFVSESNLNTLLN